MRGGGLGLRRAKFARVSCDVSVALRGLSNLCQYRDGLRMCARFSENSALGNEIELNSPKVMRWKEKPSSRGECGEIISLALMKDFGLPTIFHAVVSNVEDAITKAREFGYPTSMKAAVKGIQHKSDHGGVRLSLNSDETLVAAYNDLKARLGEPMLIMLMAAEGIEISSGMKKDPQYGPLIVVAAVGIMIELMDDRTSRLTPIG
ncbi:MAG: hypothetical protein GKR96_11345 [Gammaproteobacteria bacterium]|nr:hypothetical protein [Gammaproteobacteria bacterium]